MNDERREGIGRRTEDWLIQSIYDRMEKAEQRFEKDLEKLEGHVELVRTEFAKRVAELEAFHLRLEEREKAVLSERTGRTEKRVRWSMRVGIGAAIVAITGTIADTLRSIFHW